MAQRYFLKRALLSNALLLATGALHAQSLAPDSTQAQVPQRPPTLLSKAGLRLTRLRYSHDNQAWQFLLPLSLGAEYRAAPRISIYTQLEADLLTSYASGRRRGGQSGAVSAASAALGVRYYYGRAHQAAPIFGRYLALEGSADWEQLTTSTLRSARRRTSPAVLTPGVYVLWGVQHRLRPHLLYDLNAGAGVLAPAYYNVERPSGSTHWNVGGQVNLRLYFSL
ncbi:hypothetical protein GCM10027422_12440 [Hymenobacter arcticus]